MKQKDKELLLKDLCARLPYGVIVADFDENGHRMSVPAPMTNMANEECYYVNLKPYLRPMSSMTREEWEEYNKIKTGACYFGSSYTYLDMYDWLLAHHFDYRGLIEKGLALEAPEGMYEY